MLYRSTNPHGGDIYGEEGLLDFSANTNPFGTPEGVIEAIREVLEDIHQYPDPYCRDLVKKISEFEDLPENYILCGNGAAELIYSYVKSVKAEKALELAPTFSEYALAMEDNEGEIQRYILKKEDNFDLTEEFFDYLTKVDIDVFFLCNPNNPTGRLISKDYLKRILLICRDKDIRLFLDECFIDLSEKGFSMKDYLLEFSNLFILKAFTKSYGLAGVRLGYCLTSEKVLLQKMGDSVQPWNVSTIAQRAGIAALDQVEFIENTRQYIFAEKKILKEELEKIGYWVCDSRANFLFFQGEEDLADKLMREKIKIRDCSNYYGLSKGWYRVAVKKSVENRKLLETIRKVRED